jgi:hypothetical protein
MTPKATDRVDPITGQALTEHEALERLVGFEALAVEIDHHIASTTAHLDELHRERTRTLDAIRALIRIPTYVPTPLFDGDPT